MCDWDWHYEGALPHIGFLLCALVLPGLPPERMPKTFNRKDLDFSKLNKCINQIGQKVMIEVLRAICEKENLEEGCVTVRDYCTKRLKWTTTFIKQKISKMDLPQMDKNLREDDFDLTFTYKIITTVLSDVHSQLDENCQKQMENLKLMRNVVCHCYIDNIPVKLEDRVNDLQQIYKDIYEGVGKVLKRDFSKSISDISDNLTEVLNSQVRQDDMITYTEIVEESRKYKMSTMILDGKREQMSYYENLQLLNPCVWIDEEDYKKFKDGKEQKFSIENLFTPVQLKLEECVAIDVKDLLTVTGKSNETEYIPTALVLMGLPGSGKTSLLHYLIHVWCKKGKEIDTISDFHLVFFIEIKSVTKKSLVEYLQTHKMFKETWKVLEETWEDFDASNIIKTLQYFNLLFLIDGFDECDNAARQVIEDIICKFNDQCIIITTRPDYKEDIVFMTNRYQVNCQFIEVNGFDHKQQKLYTEKVFRLLEVNENSARKLTGAFTSKLLKFEQSQIFQEHLRWPVNLAMLIYLWKADQKVFGRVTSATLLYMEFFKHWQNELVKRLKHSSNSSCDLQETLDMLLLVLGKKAWDMLLQEESTLDRKSCDMIKCLCKEKNINVQEFMAAFLMCQMDDDRNTEKYGFNFLHKNQVEYLAAGFLAEKVRSKERSIEDIHEEIESLCHYQSFLGYLVGHLALYNQHESELLHSNMQPLLNLFDSADVPKDNYNYWWNIFIESKYNEMLGKKMAQEILPADEWVLNAEQVVSGLRLLSYIPVILKCLKIEISSDIEPYRIKYFLDLMKGLKKKLEGRYDNAPPTLVELHFWHHYEERHDKPSDEFLRTLYPWGQLTSFTGSLGTSVRGKEVLSYCIKLRSLRVQLSTLSAMKSLSNSLNSIYKSIKDICIVLVLLDDVSPRECPQLKKLKNLELCVKGIQDVQQEWWADIIKHFCGECLPSLCTIDAKGLR
ncbi:NLR family CARD domain-containing protein 4-like isoform X2 [Penaeus japonicus]|uniref:NLR family CARD domain-containing protein 4-like isoform X2 n=1 Tax=Penaeus japonicus TaxID=27405 RepID=UPI001C70CE45|nr:NLR family CARD domain-containing protein 4-like isoform X2 [Penaeus japonicus]